MAKEPRSAAFADLLRRHRVEAGLTQEALAERAGLSRRGIQNLERGVTAPYRDTVSRLLAALALPAADHLQFEAVAAASPRARAPLVVHPRHSAEPTHHLPVPLTSFVGRERELADLRSLLRQARLVTLTGPPGVGKTRLAQEIAMDLAGAFADGVRIVALAAIRDPDLVLATLAQSVHVEGFERQPLVDRLIETLKDRQFLFVLDNFEQVVAAAPLVSQLLEGCPRLTMLATSRTRLRVRGEREFVVFPLTVPDLAGVRAHSSDPISAASRSEAECLFMDRARDACPGFAVEREDARAIAEICRRLDGLPLAIELAAAWCKILPPPALLARLQDRFVLLATGPRDLPPRQQTLRDAISWSYDLLDAGEQALFRRLAVFVDGCTLEAADIVCDGKLDGLASLVDKSLVRTEVRHMAGGAGEPRFWMLETVREYAREQLATSGEDARQAQHATYFLALAEHRKPDQDPFSVGAFDRFERELGNLRAALRFLIDHGEVERASRLAAALWMFWVIRGYVDEGRGWLGDLLELTVDSDRSAARAGLLYLVARLAFKQSDNALARRRLEESLAIYRKRDDRPGVAEALGLAGLIARWQGQYDVARRVFEESLAICQELGDQAGMINAYDSIGLTVFWQGDGAGGRALLEKAVAAWRAMGKRLPEGFVLYNLGCVAHGLQDFPMARSCYEQTLAIAREYGFRLGIAEALGGLGDLALDRGDLDAAQAQLTESLLMHRDLGNRREIARVLECVAGLAAMRNQPERAVCLWGAAAALRETIAEPVPPDLAIRLDRRLGRLHQDIGEEAFARVWATGRALTPEQAIAEALAVEASPSM